MPSVPAGRTSRPPASVPSRNSMGEHNIPCDSTPFILRRPISKSPGRTAPTGANGTRSPSSKFHAPHTTCTRFEGSPASTITLRILSAPGIASIETTRDTTTASSPSPTRVMPSTTMPRSSKVSPSAMGSRSNGAKSRSHERGTSILVLSLKLLDETDVVVQQDPHVGDRVAYLSQPVDAEAKREPGPLLGVDADRPEDVGVHHAAAAKLDPPGAAAGATAAASADRACDLVLGRRLGEW